MDFDVYKEAKRIIEEVPEIIATDTDTQQRIKATEWYQNLEKYNEFKESNIEHILGRDLTEKEKKWAHEADAYNMFNWAWDQAKREGRLNGPTPLDIPKQYVYQSVGYIDYLIKSLKESQKKITPDNPFLKVKGKYDFFIDTSKGGVEKIEYIHKKVSEYLSEKEGKEFFFKPGDNSKIYTLEDNHSYQVSRMLKDAPKELQKLITQYPQTKKSKVTIKISTDPLDLVKKSTGQSWKNESCERLGGGYCHGIFSDIENNNAIAYIHLDDNPTPTGRFMLRWCDKVDEKTGKTVKDIGIEPIMYPRTAYALEIYELIRGIVESKGYGTYDDCKTPYKYTGYSDYLGGSGTITYHSGQGSQVLIQYASMPDISRNMALALAEHTTPVIVRRALAENPIICEIEDVVLKMSKDIDKPTKSNLISTCELDLKPGAVDNLVNDDEPEVREAVAAELTLSSENVRKLAEDDYILTRLQLIKNDSIKCCQDVIDKLALEQSSPKDVEMLVGLTNSSNKTISDTVIQYHGETLSPNIIQTISDNNEEQRLLNIKNLDKYPNIVRKLATTADKNNLMLLASKEYIKCCQDVIDKIYNKDETISINLLNNNSLKNIHSKIINKHKDSSNPVVLETIAHSPEICDYQGLIDHLMEYSEKSNKYIENMLARNPSISCRLDIIKKLSNSNNKSTIRNLASNNALKYTPDIMEKLWDKEDDKDVYKGTVKGYIASNEAILSNHAVLNKAIKESESNSRIRDILSSNPSILKFRNITSKFIEDNKHHVLRNNEDVFNHSDLIYDALKDTNDTISLIANPMIALYPKIVNEIYDKIVSDPNEYQRMVLSVLGGTLKYHYVFDEYSDKLKEYTPKEIREFRNNANNLISKIRSKGITITEI